MQLELWLAFMAASVVLLAIPGPTILTVVSYSASHGRRATAPLVAGVALGDSTALVLSLVGLGALLATSAAWFTTIKWAGGLYLLYLGVRQLRAGLAPARPGPSAQDVGSAQPMPSAHPVAPPPPATSSGPGGPSAAPVPDSLWRLFLNTYLVTALNPKGIVFFVAFLPQFISPAAPAAGQLWGLAVTFVVLATVNATLYAGFGSAVRGWLESPRAQRRFNLAGGTLICAAGLWALAARRQAS